MGLFKAKKSTAAATPLHEESNESSTPTTSKKKKFPFLKQRNTKQTHAAVVVDTAVTKAGKNKLRTEQKTAIVSSTEKKSVQRQEERGDTPLNDVHNSEELPEGIPRSISTPSRDENSLLPPLPATPNDDDKDTHGNDSRVGEEDSLGSPCESMLRLQKKQEQLKKNQQQAVNNIKSAPTDEELATFHPGGTTIQKLSTIISNDASDNTPTIDHLSYYIMALSSSISSNSSGDLPSKALRCLFTLSELKEDTTNKLQRVDMVKPQGPTNSGGNVKENEISLVPALLSFLQRCPRDSSEQYLTLLVLNNLSIPIENKRIIALQYNGISILSKMLCHDPGCHLLVIIIVNLTFGDEMLNRDLLNMKESENEQEKKNNKEEVEGDEGVHLVNSLSYALLLASLTAEELARLGPIPLTSPEGIPYSSRKLLSLLFSLLDSKLDIQYGANKNIMLELPPLSLGSDDNKTENNEPSYPFAETARWCLGALKNLTRPTKLAPSSSITGKGTSSSVVASQAIIEAGILPLLLRILNSKRYDNTGTIYSWETNSAQDAALYTFLHMTSVPQYRQVLMGDDDDYGCVEVLSSILRYGKVVIGERSLVKDDDGESMCQLNLQCMKARLALSYLVLGCSENSSSSNRISKYGSATTLAEHEAHSIIELLSHCLHGRAKEGPGGYSASTFALKSVLYGIKCILSQPANQKLFAVTGNASRLNTLLLKSVSYYSLLDMLDMMDAEATEHAVVSIHQMTLVGMDEDKLGCSVPEGQGIFLPASFGDDNENAKSLVAKILRSYLTNFEDGYTIKGRHAVHQIWFRLNYLRFEGSVADLTYPAGKTFPSKSDFDLDKKVLKVLSMIKTQDGDEKGTKPQEHIFNRSIARHEKDGCNSKVYSNVLAAAEDLAISIALSTQEQYPQEPLDTVAVANNITYYADGEDLYYNYSWTWGDGHGDTIERIYSAAETENQMLLQPEQGEANDAKDQSDQPYTPPRKGIFGTRIKLPYVVTTVAADENEPFTIFGLRCAAPMCGGKKDSVL